MTPAQSGAASQAPFYTAEIVAALREQTAINKTGFELLIGATGQRVIVTTPSVSGGSSTVGNARTLRTA